MNLGLADKDFADLRKDVIDPLKAAGLRVFCFGSRARGDHRPFSDLDLMIENLATSEQEALVSKLQETLSKGNFPLKVEIVDLRHFAASYLKSYHEEKIEL